MNIKIRLKTILLPLLISAVFLSGGGFYFSSSVPRAEAAAKTKWQKLLEKNKIPEELWEKYKPKVTRGEYLMVTKKTVSQAAKKSKATKWQKLLEKNGVPESLWAKYKPKVSRGEYKKVKKALKKLGQISSGSLGPEMKVGLFKLSKGNSKRIEVRSESGLEIKDKSGTVLKSVAPNVKNRIKADWANRDFSIKGRIEGDPDTYVDSGNFLTIEALGGGVIEIVDCKHQDSNEKKSDPNGCYASGSVEYNKFRGKLELSFNEDGVPWAISVLPMEQYTWGTGEIGNGLDNDYLKLFSVIFRTYAFYHSEKRTKHKGENFFLTDTSSDQIYKGYVIEERIPDMKKATQETRGKTVTYKGKTALTPYCSWTDGKTRDMNGYQYLKSVKDHPDGKKAGLDPGENGNHMYGLSANGARGWVKDGKSYEWVLKYYYTGVKIEGAY